MPRVRIAPARDTATLTLPGVPQRRGRPATGKAKTPAQRQRLYKARQNVETTQVSYRVPNALLAKIEALCALRPEMMRTQVIVSLLTFAVEGISVTGNDNFPWVME